MFTAAFQFLLSVRILCNASPKNIIDDERVFRMDSVSISFTGESGLVIESNIGLLSVILSDCSITNSQGHGLVGQTSPATTIISHGSNFSDNANYGFYVYEYVLFFGNVTSNYF